MEKIFDNLAILSVLLVGVVSPLLGCGNQAEAKLEDYLEEIEFVTPLNSTVEVSLGKYSIPVAASTSDDVENETDVTWIRLKFHLHAVVERENESQVKADWERNQGLYHDGVLNICRSASLDEVTDVRLTAIKLRLVELSRALLGNKSIRQLLCTKIITEAI